MPLLPLGYVTAELPTARHCCCALQGLKYTGGRSGKGRELGFLSLLCKPSLIAKVAFCTCGEGTTGSLLLGGMIFLKGAGRACSSLRFGFV